MASDELGVSRTQVAQLVTPPAFPAATQNDLASFNLDEAVRRATAGKGYKPASQWSLCAHCAEPCSSRERLAIEADGTVRHERCR